MRWEGGAPPISLPTCAMRYAYSFARRRSASLRSGRWRSDSEPVPRCSGSWMLCCSSPWRIPPPTGWRRSGSAAIPTGRRRRCRCSMCRRSPESRGASRSRVRCIPNMRGSRWWTTTAPSSFAAAGSHRVHCGRLLCRPSLVPAFARATTSLAPRRSL